MPDEDLGLYLQCYQLLLGLIIVPAFSFLSNSLMHIETQKTYIMLRIPVQAMRDWVGISGTALLSWCKLRVVKISIRVLQRAGCKIKKSGAHFVMDSQGSLCNSSLLQGCFFHFGPLWASGQTLNFTSSIHCASANLQCRSCRKSHANAVHVLTPA